MVFNNKSILFHPNYADHLHVGRCFQFEIWKASWQWVRLHGCLDDWSDGLANLFAGKKEMVAFQIEPLGQALELFRVGEAAFVSFV